MPIPHGNCLAVLQNVRVVVMQFDHRGRTALRQFGSQYADDGGSVGRRGYVQPGNRHAVIVQENFDFFVQVRRMADGGRCFSRCVTQFGVDPGRDDHVPDAVQQLPAKRVGFRHVDRRGRRMGVRIVEKLEVWVGFRFVTAALDVVVVGVLGNHLEDRQRRSLDRPSD